MRFAPICLTLAALIALPQDGTSIARTKPQLARRILLTGSLSNRCLPHRGGAVYLQMTLDTRGVQLPERVYRPMNVAVVLDRSGSMADEHKMDFAKKAVLSLIDRLSAEDRLSIVIYDNVIETLLPMQPVRDKSRLKCLLGEIYPRGTTNLGGGLTEGLRQLESHPDGNRINRLVLLSDGLANEGITDPERLERIAAQHRRTGVSISTIGVGLDYNEDLMLGLAEHGGGNYYFVERPGQLASIFDRELSGLSMVIAQDARIELTLGNGINLTDVIGTPWKREGQTVIVPVGDLSAGDLREYTAELSIPEGSGDRHVASGVFRTGGEDSETPGPPQFSVDIRYTDNHADLINGRNWDAQARADLALSTRSVDRAMTLLDTGSRDEAGRELARAATALQSSESIANSPACAPQLRQQIQRLQKYSGDVTGGEELRKLKKSIQYDNYTTRKNK